MSEIQNKRSRTQRLRTKQLTLMAVLTAVMIVLGYVNIPMPAGLSITFNMIPVAVAAIVMGVWGGVAMGAVFGTISFLQCFGIVGFSPMGSVLAGVSVPLCFIQRVVTRVLMGLITALVFKALRKRCNLHLSCLATGFSAAFFNTLFFMSALVLLFGGTEYMQEKMAGRAFLAYLVASVGLNGLVEMATSAVLTGVLGVALKKARMIA